MRYGSLEVLKLPQKLPSGNTLQFANWKISIFFRCWMDSSAINGPCWKSKLLVITRGYWGFSTSRNCGRSFCITGLVFIKSWPETMFLPAGGKPRQRFNVFENTHILSVACTAYVTSLGWVGWGMLTFMLTCVTCTSYIILCYVTGLALDELQDEQSYGGHRSSLERPCGNVSWKKRPGEFSGTNSL